MHELEKILEEVKSSAVYAKVKGGYGAVCLPVGAIERIINKHMNGNAHCGECSRRKWYQKGFEDGKKSKEKWIPVEERLPEEKTNPVTQDFYEYQVTAKFQDIEDIRNYKFGNGHWWHGPGIVDQYVVAWLPRPDPYRKEG